MSFLHISVIFIIIVTLLIVDTSITKFFSFVSQSTSLQIEFPFFTFLFLVSVSGQIFILWTVAKKTKNLSSTRRLSVRYIHFSTTAVQLIIIALLFLLQIQISFFSFYSVFVITLVLILSYSLSISLLAFLAWRFISWHKFNPSPTIILYGLAMLVICSNMIFTLFYASNALLGQYEIIKPHSGHIIAFFTQNPLVSKGFFVSSISSFILLWIATVTVIRNYREKLRKITFWVLLCAPLFYFLIQFFPFTTNLFYIVRLANPVFFGIVYTLFFSLSKSIGGILFALAFWFISKNIDKRIIKEYMLFSAYGLLLLFAANQAIAIVNYPYPPFGVFTISFLGLGTYLVLLGIFSAAVSVSQDNKLRNLIRKSVNEKASFLYKIGTSEMEQDLINRMVTTTSRLSEQMKKETDIESSLTEQDLRQLINQAIKEVRYAGQG